MAAACIPTYHQREEGKLSMVLTTEKYTDATNPCWRPSMLAMDNTWHACTGISAHMNGVSVREHKGESARVRVPQWQSRVPEVRGCTPMSSIVDSSMIVIEICCACSIK